jgi:predicted lipoprotein with Yx(FWY)xxD motif
MQFVDTRHLAGAVFPDKVSRVKAHRTADARALEWAKPPYAFNFETTWKSACLGSCVVDWSPHPFG